MTGNLQVKMYVDREGNIFPNKNYVFPTAFFNELMIGSDPITLKQEIVMASVVLSVDHRFLVKENYSGILSSNDFATGFFFGKSSTDLCMFLNDPVTKIITLHSDGPTQDLLFINRTTKDILGGRDISSTRDIVALNNVRATVEVIGPTVVTNNLTGSSSTKITVNNYFKITSANGVAYANPTTSTLLYSDIDDTLKTRNTLGEVVSFSNRPVVGQIYGGSHSPVLSTADTYTRISNLTSVPAFCAPNFSLYNTYYLRYDGLKKKVFKISFFTNTYSSTLLQQYSFAIYKNPTINGSGEITGGDLITEISHYTAIALIRENVSFVSYTPDENTIQTNDFIGVFLKNSSAVPSTASIEIVNPVLILEALSVGLD